MTIGLRQGEGGEPVVVHARADVAVGFVLLFEQKTQSFPDDLGVGTRVGIFSVREESDDRQADDSRLFAVVIGPATLIVLSLNQ
jgi:hypothetical protein